MADYPHVLTTEVPAHAELHLSPEHIGPEFLGMGPDGWVGVAMLIFLALLIWKGVHKIIAGMLDSKIVAIRSQLEDAKTLRAEAEALRQEYAAKIADAEKDAAAMLEHAKVEAETIVINAEAESETAIARRRKMAEDKIAAAERSAIEELRTTAANAAAAAAGQLIAEKYEAEADRRLVDQAISIM